MSELKIYKLENRVEADCVLRSATAAAALQLGCYAGVSVLIPEFCPRIHQRPERRQSSGIRLTRSFKKEHCSVLSYKIPFLLTGAWLTKVKWWVPFAGVVVNVGDAKWLYGDSRNSQQQLTHQQHRIDHLLGRILFQGAALLGGGAAEGAVHLAEARAVVTGGCWLK